MLPKIIDTNNIVTRALAGLKTDGVEVIGRYLTTGGGDKLVSKDEARAIAAAGMRLFLVFEVYGGAGKTPFQHNDITADSGAHHGLFTRSYAPSIGTPDGTIIYFAIDTDAGAVDFDRRIVPYLKAVRSALAGRYRLGLYANGYCCGRALDEGLVDTAWLSQSMGWRGSRAFKDSNRWALLQGPETALRGLSIDSNTANPAIPDFGAFVPFGGAQAPAPAPPGDRPSPAVDDPPPKPPAPDSPPAAAVPPETVRQIMAIAAASSAARRPWSNGVAPLGYTKGMAVAYAMLLLRAGGSYAALDAPVGSPAHDVLAWYGDVLSAVHAGVGTALERRRAAFAIMFGLGMRESGGNFCEGWDREETRDELTADSAEAGLFQMSWNAHDIVPAIGDVVRAYGQMPDDPEGLGPILHEGINVTDEQLEDYGGGDGAAFQRLAKASPMMAIATTAIGVRLIGGQFGHWGPIRKHKAQVRDDVIELLRAVEEAMTGPVA